MLCSAIAFFCLHMSRLLVSSQSQCLLLSISSCMAFQTVLSSVSWNAMMGVVFFHSLQSSRQAW